MKTIQNILVPVDFSEASIEAAHLAASLAQVHDARLFVLQVKEPYPVHGRVAAGYLEDVQKHRLKKDHTALAGVIPAQLKNSIAVKEIQVTGVPVYRVIIEKAREIHADLIVIPLQARSGWAHFFKKNTGAQVVRRAPCSVLAVRTSQG